MLNVCLREGIPKYTLNVGDRCVSHQACPQHLLFLDVKMHAYKQEEKALESSLVASNDKPWISYLPSRQNPVQCEQNNVRMIRTTLI